MLATDLHNLMIAISVLNADARFVSFVPSDIVVGNTLYGWCPIQLPEWLLSISLC